MPLDWSQVKERYPTGEALLVRESGRRLEIAGVDDEGIHIRSSLWTKTATRAHLEEAVLLIESGEMSNVLTDFVEEFGKRVTKERRTLTAFVLEDLGYLK